MKLKQITPNLMVADVAASTAFWQQTLGFEMLMRFPEEGDPVWAMLRKDEIVLQFQERKAVAEQWPFMNDRTPGGCGTFYVNTDDVKTVYEKLKNAPGKMLSEPEETFYHTLEFTYLDMDGFLFTFAEDLPGHEA